MFCDELEEPGNTTKMSVWPTGAARIKSETLSVFWL